MSPQSPNLPNGRWPAGAAPTRQAALKRLAAVRPGDYARSRNHIEGAVTGLSPYLSHGLLNLPEVLKGVLESGPLTVGHKLVYELGWREFFRHVWAHEGDGILESLHEGPLPEAAYARELPEDIRCASTGVPVIDQAVRTLYATGTLHNHARMWLASYVVHLRRVHWRAGADWLVAHLLDGDLASNHLSSTEVSIHNLISLRLRFDSQEPRQQFRHIKSRLIIPSEQHAVEFKRSEQFNFRESLKQRKVISSDERVRSSIEFEYI
jgi:deoxyribodipyrimidine photo-lyase